MKYIIVILISIFVVACAGEKKEEGCKKDFHTENNECVSNKKMVDCNENFKPENSDFVKRKVEITWDKKWSEPDDCESKCRIDYVRTEYGCDKV